MRESLTHEVVKWSDITHAKRSFGSLLYSLQPQHKGILSTKVINHFLKCFGYALSHDGLEKNLKAIVPHAFGKHNKFDRSWCGFLKSPTTYKHKSLPRGKDLKGEKLEEDLNAVADIFVQNSEKLAPLGSNQSNEALNNTIGSKAPKIRHYGGSESNDFRVACAVSQKNVGYSYVAKVSISFT